MTSYEKMHLHLRILLNLGEYKFSSACAPSILIIFINMMLFKEAKVPERCEEFMFSWQGELQYVLVVAAVLCIPVMLFGKPLYMQFTRKKGNQIVST